MIKTKRIISMMLCIAMVVGVLTVTILAADKKKNLSDVTMYEFIADIWCGNGGYYISNYADEYPQTEIHYYADNEGWTERLSEAIRSDKKLMHAIAAWEGISAFDDVSGTVTDKFSTTSKYEIVLLNILKEIIKNDEFQEQMNARASDISVDISSLLSIYMKNVDNIDIYTQNVSASAICEGIEKITEFAMDLKPLLEAEKDFNIAEIQLYVIEAFKETDTQKINEIVQKIAKNYAGLEKIQNTCKKISEEINAGSLIIEQGLIVSDFVRKISMYSDLSALNDNYIAYLKIIAENIRTANPTLYKAIVKVTSSLQDAQARLIYACEDFINQEIGVLFEIVWESLIDIVKFANPWLIAVEVAYEVTMSMIDFTLGNNDKVEKVYLVLAFSDVYNLIRNTYYLAESRYLASETPENAGIYVAAVDVLYVASILDCHYSIAYHEALLEGALTKLFTSEKTEKMVENNISSSVSEKNMHSDNYKTLYNFIFAFLKYIRDGETGDYEEIFKEYSNLSIIAHGTCGSDIRWILYNTGELVLSGSGPMNNFSRGRAPWYGYREYITSLAFDSRITSIGNYAFADCTGFCGSLWIRSGIKTIGTGAFSGCTGLDGYLNIYEGVVSIGYAAFRDCTGFTGDLVIPDSVTSIGDYAFSGCTGFAGDLVISESVVSIGVAAFEGCRGFTGDLVIPESVTSIGFASFRYCSGFMGDLVIPEGVVSIETSAFYGCSGFTGGLVIPDGVTSIGACAFYDCTGFTGDLMIPEGVVSIGFDAFYGCSGFTGDLVIPEGVTSIGGRAFEGCTGFTGDLVIPESITSIGNSAFRYCSGFTGDLVIPEGVVSLGQYIFEDCTGFTGDLVIPESVTSIGYMAFYGCTGFTGDLVIPEGVVSIGECAFSGCTGFTGDLVIPESVTSIERMAFNRCRGFTGDLVIPEGVVSIGERAFSGCTGFTRDLVISEGVTSIGVGAFSGCTGFTGKLVLPESVTSIGGSSFGRCTGFTGDLVIPESVTSIGNSAFSGCSGISKAEFLGDVPSSWGTKVFDKNAPDFVIQYYPGNTSGWTSPTWIAPDGTEYNTILLGDINLDSFCNMADYKLFTEYFAGYEVKINEAAADIDGDGKITRRDAMILARYLAGWEGYTLPYSKK